MSEISYAKCHHVYEPQREDELKLNVGDAVEVTSKEYDTWWVGKNLTTQQSGWFPSNFVTSTEAHEIEQTSAESPSKPQQMPQPPQSPEPLNTQSNVESHEEQVEPVAPKASSAVPKASSAVPKANSLAEVQHDYEAQASDELSLEKGAIVTILEEVDGWYKGDLNGRIGLFPANFVKRIEGNSPESEVEEAQPKQKGFRLAAYGVKQGGIGSLFAGGMPSLRKANRHSQEIQEHQAPVVEAANEAPISSPKKNIPLPPTPPTPQAEHQEEPAANKSSSTLSSEAHVPEKPDLPRVSADSSTGRQSIEESRSPSPTKRRSVFGGFRPPIPKIPIPKFPTLPKKNIPAVPREEGSTATSPPEQAIAEPSLETAQPTSPKVPHVRTPLPPIPSGLPPTLPSSPPQAPHARSPLPPVPQEDSHVSSPPPPASQEQRNIRSSLPPVPHMEPHVRSPLPPVPQMESHVKSPLPPAPQEQRNVRVSLPPVPHMEPHIRSPLPAVPQEQPHIRSPLPPVPQGVPDVEPPLSPVHHEEPAISSVDEPEHLGESHASSSLPPMYTSEAQPNEQVLEGSQVNPDMEKKNRSLDSEEHSGPKLALVEDDFEAQSSSHLTLRKGGVVTILAQGEDWWRGEMNGKIGLFPPHLVKIIEQPAEGGETSESGGNAPRGGFRLAAYGVKQGGIGGLFAGGLPKLRKTGRRMGSEEPSNTPNEPERSQASSTSTPELRTQASDLPPYGTDNEAPSRSNTHESAPQIPSVPSRTSTYESESPMQNLSHSSTRESLPPVPSVSSHTSTYEPETQVQNSSLSNTREALPPVPSVPSRTSTYESEPPMENLSRTSTRDSLPQVPSIPSRTSTHESVPQVPSIPSRTSTYESSPSIPSRTSTHESVPQIPSVPSRTTSDPHSEHLESLDSSSQIPVPLNRSDSDEPQANNQQYQDDNLESQLAAPVIPSRSSSTDISPQIPSRAPQPISSRSSAYSVDSELAALENTIPSSRSIPELEADSEAPEPALPSRTSFYRVDTPRSPTPGQSVHFDSGPHSPTTPLPSGNGSQTELPIPTGLPSRENTQESSPSIPPRRSPSFGLGQSSRSGRELSQRNSVHGYDSIGSPIRTDHSSQLNKRNSVQDILVSSPIPNREENDSPDDTSNQLDTYSDNDDTGVISLKSENEEFFEANDELEIPHEPEPTPNNATPRHVLEEHDMSTNLEQVDRALISETLEENSKRGIDQVERTFVADDNSKKQEIENLHDESTSQVVENLNESDKVDEDVEEVNTQPIEEDVVEEDQQVPEESATPLLPALPESQPLSSLTKGRPMRNKRKPTPVAREAPTSQTELLQKAIEEDTQAVDTSKESEKSSVEPVKAETPISREISKESSDKVNNDDSEPRLVKPSAFRGQATPFANLSFGKSGVPGLLNKTGHVGELGRRIGSGNYENNHGEGTSTSDIAPRKYQGVAGASQALALSELENKMKNWMKEELQKLKEELKEEREARQRLEEELRELKESRE